MRLPLPAPAGWGSYLAAHPVMRNPYSELPLRVTWWRDPATGDLWRESLPGDFAGEPPSLILDTLVVDGIRYRTDWPPDYSDCKIPNLIA